jgi:hypothetical protein
MTRFLAWGLLSSLVGSPLHAQRLGTVRAGIQLHCEPNQSEVACDPRPMQLQGSSSASPWSVLFSAIVPGTGQAIVGSSRALPYLAIEAFAWTSFVRHSLQYRRRRDGYRELAANVARAPFSPTRPNGDFEYYERMAHYREAGRYDIVAGGALEPETDTSTYNGAVWLLARRTYWSDPFVTPTSSSPEWSRAIGFYEARAYDQLYRWSWTNAPQEYEAFLGLIGASNDANRLAMLDLGVVIANHVLSTVDAYVTLRLRNDPLRREFAIEGQFPVPRVFR